MKNKDNKQYTKPEILAPAGSMEALKAAVYAGADAVYVGGSQFGARAFAANFSKEELLEAIDFVHCYGVKIYLTVNTLLKEKEIKQELVPYLLPFYKHGLDAVIVQDVGVFSVIRREFPDLAIHVSTQMGIMNQAGAKWMKQLGATRVVPARELSLSEIQTITSIEGLEVECFVHGALCYCYSGQCLLSSRIGGRSGNRGRCAQPCRLPYLYENKHSYLLSPKDMCTISLLPELIEAGIDSFKIEGRMKKQEYVACVTGLYKKYTLLALESLNEHKEYHVDSEDLMKLMQVYNRGGFHKGYYQQHNGEDMMVTDRPNHHGVYLGKINSVGQRSIRFQTEEDIYPGDVIEVRMGEDTVELTSPLLAKKGCLVELNAGQMRKMKPNLSIYRMKSPALNELALQPAAGRTQIVMNASVTFAQGEKLQLTVWDAENRQAVTVEGTQVELAKNQPMTEEKIKKAICQTGGTEYIFDDVLVTCIGNGFMPVGMIKDLRRQALELWSQQLTKSYYRENSKALCHTEAYDDLQDFGDIRNSCNQIMVLVHDDSQLDVALDEPDIQSIIISLQFEHRIEDIKNHHKECYIQLPNMFRKNGVNEELICRCLTIADGVMVSSVDAFAYCLSLAQLSLINKPKKMVLDSSLYAYNKEAIMFYINAIKVQKIWTLSGMLAPSELTFREIYDIQNPYLYITVYGKQRMMTSVQCVKKTTGQCNHKPEFKMIQDRKGKEFLVETVCSNCYNQVFENDPLALMDCVKDVEQLNPKGIYFSFTNENKLQMKQILDSFIGQYGKGETEITFVDGNSGHYFDSID